MRNKAFKAKELQKNVSEPGKHECAWRDVQARIALQLWKLLIILSFKLFESYYCFRWFKGRVFCSRSSRCEVFGVWPKERRSSSSRRCLTRARRRRLCVAMMATIASEATAARHRADAFEKSGALQPQPNRCPLLWFSFLNNKNTQEGISWGLRSTSFYGV